MSQSKIIVPRRRIIIPRMVIRERRAPPPKFGVRLQPQHMRYEVGRYRERLRSGPGGLGRGRIWTPEHVGEQHNLILDGGYDLPPTYGFTGLAQYAAVGTGSTAPSAGDTALEAEVARTRNIPSGESDQTAHPSTGRYELTRVREFTEAEVGGQNLTEWGWAPASTGQLFTRELFRDGNGTPVTLTLASDQRLRLIYTYALDMAPTGASPGAFSLNMQNIGTLTGKVFWTGWVYAINNYYGDLVIADLLVKGEGSSSSNPYGFYFSRLTSAVTPGDNVYYPGNDFLYGNNVPVAAYSPGSRQRTLSSSLMVDTDTFNGDNYGWGWAAYEYSYGSDYRKVFVALALDNPLTKDNLHKILFDPWTYITW